MQFSAPRAFRHRNYRIFFAGQFISLTGTWVRAVAIGWLAYRLSASPFLLGVVSFAAYAPIFFVSPIAGAIADRLNRRHVFTATQALIMVQTAVLAVLTLTGLMTIPWLIALSLFGGIVTAVEVPVRQAFTIEMVGRDDLRQAIALNATMFNIARTLGPAFGGIVIALIGEGWCFALTTLTYGAVITSLLMMRFEPRPPRAKTHPWEDLKKGFSYVSRHVEIRTAILLSAATGFFGMSFFFILPAHTEEVLHLGSEALGFTMAGFGIGAALGAITSSRMSERWQRRVPLLSAAGLGIGLIAFANVTTLPLAVALIIPTGFAYLMLACTNNCQIQLLSDDSMRGRVMSFYAMGALGGQPLGSLLLGYLADRHGVPNAFMFGGVACLLIALVCYWYLRRVGILGTN
ncbi:MAG: MFS transporter [Micropepsaceae bacterium]